MERKSLETEQESLKKDWSKEVAEFAARNRQEILRDLAALIALPSVEGQPGPDAPFGPGPRQALDKALELAEKMGLETHHQDYKLGWAEVKGESEDYLATITHLDVVPAGNGWDTDPFTLCRREGWLLGRGVADDKGASVLCLYALKFFKEKKLRLPYGLRALLGCNEETGMLDLPPYLENHKPPIFCFTPDAEFPVCNGEKGHYGARLVSPAFSEGRILDWQGGVATNAVPDRSWALVRADLQKLTPTEHITLKAQGENVLVEGWGKSGHAALPQGTCNAIWLVASYLLKNDLCSPGEREYLRVLEKLHQSTDGAGLGIAAKDGRFDPLTVIGGTMKKEKGCFVQTLDCRYPTNMNAEKLTQALRQAAGEAARVEMVDDAPPFYIEADAAPIQALIETYNQVTGSSEKPFTMGGGTYARHFPLAVSFGPEYPNTQLPAFGGGMHGANEAIEEEGLFRALEIYILALLRLESLDRKEYFSHPCACEEG